MEENYKKCLHCNTRIDHRSGQAKYCSRFCYNDMLVKKYREQVKNGIVPIKCLYCKTEFLPTTRRQKKFCKFECSYRYRLNAMTGNKEERMCENCSDVFKPARAFSVFCSPKCRNQTTVLKRAMGVSAAELRALNPELTTAQRRQKDLNTAHAEVIAKELEEQDLPLCTLCAVNKVRDPEAPNQQCPSCILVTEAQERARQKCEHLYDTTNRCGICGESAPS